MRTDGAVVFMGTECGRNFGNLNGKLPICGPRNSRQLFIRTHNETLSVAAMRVNNPDRSPVAINR